jgi:hypothetical protein
MFYECFNAVTGETGRPRAWGEKVDAEVKTQLLNDGWHKQVCTEEDDETDDELVKDQEMGILQQDKGRNCRKRNIDSRTVGNSKGVSRISASSAAAFIGGFKSMLRDA